MAISGFDLSPLMQGRHTVKQDPLSFVFQFLCQDFYYYFIIVVIIIITKTDIKSEHMQEHFFNSQLF